MAFYLISQMYSPSGHPRCRRGAFLIRTDMEKVIIASLAHQWIICSEWVPSEWESKQLLKTSLWRGGRGKAERARGRVGSETSGESVGKWIMINTCIWFQWLPGRLEKAPAGLQWGGSNAPRERESVHQRRSHETTTEEERRSFVYVLLLLFILCY